MHKITHTPIHIGAAILGLITVSAETYSNIEHVWHQARTWYDPAIVNVLAMSLCVAFGIAVTMQAFKQRSIATGLVLGCAFVIGAAYVISVTLDRTSAQRDTALTKVYERDTLYLTLLASYTTMRMDRARICTGGSRLYTQCDQVEREMERVVGKLDQRKEELDSFGRRVAAVFPWVSARTASTWQPMLLPISLFLFGAWLLHFAWAGQRVPAEFDLELQGPAAERARAERFLEQFRAKHGRDPYPSEIAKVIPISQGTARRVVMQSRKRA